MKERLKNDLLKSGYVHSPLPIYYEDTREARCENKPIVKTRLLDDFSDLSAWSTTTKYFAKRDFDGLKLADGDNLAHVELDANHIIGESKNSVKFTSSTWLPNVPEKEGWGGGIMCIPSAVFNIADEDWSDYNRISCYIYPDMPGFRNICLRMQFHNGGEHPAPDPYDRVGHHNVNLVNGQWNHIQVEIPYIYRDHVTGISFDYDMCGSEPQATKTACWYIADLRIDKLAEEELDHHTGWNTAKGRIAYSNSGYQAGSIKTALMCSDATNKFKLINAATNKPVLTKAVQAVKTPTGEFNLLDFSEITDSGEYYLDCGGIKSNIFAIGDDVWEDSIWKTINFFLCERCGYYVPGKHNACCIDRFCEHNGLKVSGNGGWHDAGDMSQNLTNTSESVVAFFSLALRFEQDNPLYSRLVEEGLWGLEWMLKTRFGDGYRAMAVGGYSYWTNGIIGDGDDSITQAENNPIENFTAAGAEALGAQILSRTDKTYAEYSLKCAKEDWKHAYRDRESEGYKELGDPARASHSVVMYSVAVWSALYIYNTDGDEYFKDMAIKLAGEITACQQQEIPDWDDPFTGFFYRDSERKLIVHYNHRSHESEPLLALTSLCESFPNHPDWIKWYYAIVLYSEYYKKAIQYTAPYDMSPASIYHINEASDDPDLFVKQQAEAGYETIGMYERQVKEGVSLGKGFYLRRFPVWFGFRGNHAIALSGGKAAALCGRVRGSYQLAEYGQRQLEWIVGKNPFAQSVMYGEGYDYCQQYAILPGEMVGELSVGIETFEDLDSPHWPQVCTCTYKEVWVHNPLRWLWLCADVYGPAEIYGKAEGTIACKNIASGKKYTLKPDKNGSFRQKLPAGVYELSYKGVKKQIELAAGCSRCVAEPFAAYSISTKRNGKAVSAELSTSGKGSATLDVRLENLNPISGKGNVTLGDTITLQYEIIDEKRPYLAVIIPNDCLDDKLELFGQ